MQVLVVDDDVHVAKRVGDILRQRGHRVRMATSAQAAVLCLRAGGYDLVISDFNLGDATGDFVLRYASLRCPYATRVLVTGAPERVWSMLLRTGLAHRVVVKPFDTYALYAALVL